MGWYIDNGPESDVIITSRIRLARNLQNIAFPRWLSEDKAIQVAKNIEDSFKTETEEKKYNVVELEKLTDIERIAFFEKHLISQNMLQGKKGQALLISKDESHSILINEEDHMRVQSMQAGFNLEKAYQVAEAITLKLEAKLPIGFEEKLGFITACPTNLGTGMRASVMVHLPGLKMTGVLNHLMTSIGKMGYAIRGMYGEGSASAGDLYQISNQLTLGLSEQDILEELHHIVEQIMEREREARYSIYQRDQVNIEDMVLRAYGILTQARILDSKEAYQLLSHLRLGLSLNIIEAIELKQLNQIQTYIGPASIERIAGKPLEEKERDEYRADFIRKILIKE